MVYGGKPSTGCQNCRNRHIKCDEARPCCRACVRTGRTCPGYKHPLDVMLRDRIAFQRKKNGPAKAKNTASKMCKTKEPSPKSSPTPKTSASPTMDLVPTAIPEQAALPVNVMRSPSPRGLYLPMEDAVTSLFFNSYLYLPKDSQFNNGFMELLPQSYSTTKFGTHLHLSTLAVSFFSVAAWTGQRSLLRTSEQFFLRALPRVRQALQEDIDNNLDEMLLTVLLLSTYEELSALKDWKMPQKAHLRGAVALINSRDPGKLNSPLSKVLTYAVQTQIIKTSQGLAYPTVQTPNVWPLSSPIVPTAPSQLTMSASELVNLRLAWEKWSASRQPRQEARDILLKAQSLDDKFLTWARSVPPHWIPVPATVIPQSVRKAGLFQNQCDCYTDMWVASTWNSYRDSRIVVQTIIRGCLRALEDGHSSQSMQTTDSIIHTLATEICATIPFYIGSQKTPVRMSPQKIDYPEAEDRKITSAHKRMAPLLGGWFLLSYLGNMCSPGLCLDAGHLIWIKEQIQRILQIYTFGVYQG